MKIEINKDMNFHEALDLQEVLNDFFNTDLFLYFELNKTIYHDEVEE